MAHISDEDVHAVVVAAVAGERERSVALAAENAKLREALQPFANGGSEIPDNWPDNRGLLIDENHPDNPKRHSLLLGFVSDFRRARDVLKQVSNS